LKKETQDKIDELNLKIEDNLTTLTKVEARLKKETQDKIDEVNLKIDDNLATLEKKEAQLRKDLNNSIENLTLNMNDLKHEIDAKTSEITKTKTDLVNTLTQFKKESLEKFEETSLKINNFYQKLLEIKHELEESEKRTNDAIVDTNANLKNELTELNLMSKNQLLSKIENVYSQLKLD